MQEYGRRIAYLYAYERGRKTRSCGFIKLKTRDRLSRLHIHLKCYRRLSEDPGYAYIFFYRRGRMIAIPLGELSSGQDGALEWRGDIDPENVLGKGVRLTDTGGIWVKRPNCRDYVAEWHDGSVDVSRFILYPNGGEHCIRCPRFGICERSSSHAADRR